MLDQGVIVERGTHQQLLARGGLYASMWNRQREAEKAREMLAEVEDDGAAPNRNPPAVDAGRRGSRSPGSDRRRCRIAPMSVLASIRAQLVAHPSRGLSLHRRRCAGQPDPVRLWTPLGWLATLATLWCAYFFRDPQRVTPVREGIVVAPADGRVSRVTNAAPPKELDLGDRPLPRISIFMSVFDCHVNRSPVAGRIERIVYRAGTFINADLDKASEDNERNAFVIATATPAHRGGADRRPRRAAHQCVCAAKASNSAPASASA